MTTPFAHVGIVGGGAWGTALALTAQRAGRRVTLWALEPEVVDDINTARRNARYLPGHAIEPGIVATGSLNDLAACDVILLVTPAQASRALAQRLAPLVTTTVPIVVCAKGIEAASGNLIPTAVADALPGRSISMLSGPTFAEEVARGLPTAITLASPDRAQGEALAHALRTPTFRPYWTDDVIGVALGGAIKNVLAIACGIVEGRKLGDNARAALLTRGFAEMARLGVAMGARLETLAGLAGLGDLTLTCNGPLSRNRSLGAAIGQGIAAADFLAGKPSVAEGFHTAPIVQSLAARYQVDMPICTAVAALLHDGADVDATIRALLARPLKGEGE